MTEYRNLPSVREILEHPEVSGLADSCGRRALKSAARQAVDLARQAVRAGGEAPVLDEVAAETCRLAGAICGGSLRTVINATGVVLHTNLGRAPLGRAVIDEVAAVACGYSNLEFDLEAGRRGNRSVHLREMLRVLTGAEDALVVNNNAAGILLALSTLAAGREVIVSRGELIEIGDSFRIPEIMAASGARMVEVGTTNRTRLSDYERAVTPDTAVLFKAHKSNYVVRGFTAEVPAAELSGLARERGLTLFYDLGSGLLRRPGTELLSREPEVAEELACGADLVSFSCDKLVGGPQGGVVAGRAELISRLKRAPLMRALRVGKLTLAALGAACRQYLREGELLRGNPALAMISREVSELEGLADRLLDACRERGVEARVVESAGQSGGGALPGLTIPSRAVEIVPREGIGDAAASFAERVYRRLMTVDLPLLAVLREGRLLLDVLALTDGEIPRAADAVAKAIAAEGAR
jgi:L-seryl-tRNA(Ser) seleniumtransferase